VIIPVRCFTCGKVVGSAYEVYQKRVKAGESPEKILDTLGLERYCCRRMILANAELVDDALPFG
jgi:DNA-directed RNA polymerase subunit N